MHETKYAKASTSDNVVKNPLFNQDLIVEHPNAAVVPQQTPMQYTTLAQLYTLVSQYFQNPLLTKIKSVGEYSLYGTQTSSNLLKTNKYVLVFVNCDDSVFGIGDRRPLRELSWVSLQTRTLEELYRVNKHTYIPNKQSPLYTCAIIQNKENKEGVFYYSPNFAFLNITLLHNPNLSAAYQPRGNLVLALEQYDTIITIKSVNSEV